MSNISVDAGPLAAAVRLAMRRLIPILAILGMINLLDRASVGYASLTMNADLGLSAAAYGFGAGIFFLGYVIFEVPSNMIMQRVGARLWIARIGVTWGLVMILMAFVWDDWSFYATRILLGLAEAGLFPAVYYLLGTWFPIASRAKAIAIFLAGGAVAGIIGGPLSSVIFLAADATGFTGWRVLFIALGIPSIIIALVVLRIVPNTPADAKWLAPDQSRALIAELERETRLSGLVADASAFKGLARALKNPQVWIFVVIFFTVAMANYGMTLFLPQIIQSFAVTVPTVTLLLTSIPFVAGLIAMLLVARSSDRRGDRRWHFIIVALVGAVGLFLTASLLGSPILAMAALCLVAAGLLPLSTLMFARISGLLTGAAAAAGIAFINAVGSIGGFVGPIVIGGVLEASGSFYVALLILSGGLFLAALLTFLFRTPAEKRITREQLLRQASAVAEPSMPVELTGTK